MQKMLTNTHFKIYSQKPEKRIELIVPPTVDLVFLDRKNNFVKELTGFPIRKLKGKFSNMSVGKYFDEFDLEQFKEILLKSKLKAGYYAFSHPTGYIVHLGYSEFPKDDLWNKIAKKLEGHNWESLLCERFI